MEDYHCCGLCKKPFQTDFMEWMGKATNRLPVSCRACPHTICHRCYKNVMLVEWQEQVDDGKRSMVSTAIECMKCKTVDGFDAYKPNYNHLACRLIEQQRRQQQPQQQRAVARGKGGSNTVPTTTATTHHRKFPTMITPMKRPPAAGLPLARRRQQEQQGVAPKASMKVEARLPVREIEDGKPPAKKKAKNDTETRTQKMDPPTVSSGTTIIAASSSAKLDDSSAEEVQESTAMVVKKEEQEDEDDEDLDLQEGQNNNKSRRGSTTAVATISQSQSTGSSVSTQKESWEHSFSRPHTRCLPTSRSGGEEEEGSDDDVDDDEEEQEVVVEEDHEEEDVEEEEEDDDDNDNNNNNNEKDEEGEYEVGDDDVDDEVDDDYGNVEEILEKLKEAKRRSRKKQYNNNKDYFDQQDDGNARRQRKPRQKLLPRSETERSKLEGRENWFEEFQTWLADTDEVSAKNIREVKKQVRLLNSGEGIGYRHWPDHVVFRKGLGLDITMDFHTMLEEAIDYEKTYGKDKGNGWLLRHPIKKLGLFQAYLLDDLDGA